MRSMFLMGLGAVALVAAIGCDNAADEQRKANAAQAEADKKMAEAKSQTEITSAQIEADKKIAAAQANFSQMREDFRHKIQGDLVDLDKKIDNLEAKSKKETGKSKADLDAALRQIRAQRQEFDTNFRSLDSVTANGWDDAKARVEQQWKDLKNLVDKA